MALAMAVTNTQGKRTKPGPDDIRDWESMYAYMFLHTIISVRDNRDGTAKWRDDTIVKTQARIGWVDSLETLYPPDSGIKKRLLITNIGQLTIQE
ncbi:unnamed protein product [Caretta caretta]